MTSLRRRLLVALLAAVAAVTVVTAALVYRMARQELDALSDDHLRQVAQALRTGAPAGGAAGAEEEGDLAIQIWDRDGTRLYLSSPGAGLPASAALGFATVAGRSGAWRVYSAELGELVVQVAQPLATRQARAVAAALRTLAPVLLMLPLLAALVWLVVGRALSPLDRLAREVAARSPASLEPLRAAGVPDEVVPLVRALDGLLRRLAGALAAQRAFVADAAHELRTPLAALELQAQLVASADEPAERARAIGALREGLARAAHVVRQLLTLARAEPDAGEAFAAAPVALAGLVAQVVADHAVLAEARGVDLGAARAAAEAVVPGDAAALRTLLANLVENALRHSPAGGRVDVDAGVEGGRPFLEVSDQGPGIPPADRELVFQRFFRRGGEGSGLGLAIVKAVADRHGAAVTLADTPGGGLTVRVQFPTLAAAPPPPKQDDPS